MGSQSIRKTELAVGCPMCGAIPGQPCSNLAFQMVHNQRALWLIQEEAAQEEHIKQEALASQLPDYAPLMADWGAYPDRKPRMAAFIFAWLDKAGLAVHWKASNG